MAIHHIAVLPFVNLSSNPENEFFVDGITEEIISALAKVESIRVTSRRSVFYFKDKQLPLKEIAAQLGVSVILEGSVRLVEDTVRVSCQLIQAEQDYHFWSESWDRKLKNIFAIQDEISLLIADKLREQFGHFEIQDQLVKPTTNNLDAYALTLKANYYYNRWNPEDIYEAINLYEQALDLDPQQVAAYVGLADAYGFLANTEFISRQDGWLKAIGYINKALLLDPNHAGPHYQLANHAFFVELDFTAAITYIERALELRPNYSDALRFMAFLRSVSGELELAKMNIQHALLLDPLSQETLFFRAYYLYRSGEEETALQQTEDCLKVNSQNIPAYVLKAYCLLALDRYNEVLQCLAQIPEELVIAGDQLGICCLAHIRAKQEQQAAQSFEELYIAAQQTDAFQAHSYLFMAYVNKGDLEAAFNWLAQCIEHRSTILLMTFSSPLVAAIKEDARYTKYYQLLYQLPTKAKLQKPAKAPLLTELKAKKYEEQLLQYLEEEQPFLNPALSLRLLASQLGLHANQLSWLLNDRVGKNFNAFINAYRVEHFKALAKDAVNAHISLLGLAYESGFNSKTVFNTAFKKEVGMTPRAFLKQA